MAIESICVVGLGYIGLPTAAVASLFIQQTGHDIYHSTTLLLEIPNWRPWSVCFKIKKVLLDLLNDGELLQWRKVHHHHVSIDRLQPDGITWYSAYGSISYQSSAQGGRHSSLLVSRSATDRGISYYRFDDNSPSYYDTTAISYNYQYVLGYTMVYLIRLLLEKYNQQSIP